MHTHTLTQGFARYMEFVAVDAIYPEWGILDEFVQSVHGLALGLDAMQSSHPIQAPFSRFPTMA